MNENLLIVLIAIGCLITLAVMFHPDDPIG